MLHQIEKGNRLSHDVINQASSVLWGKKKHWQFWRYRTGMESVLTKKREGPWTLSNIVQINVETGNVESKSFNIVNSNVDVHKVVSTLILHCATSRHHINLKTTLKCLLGYVVLIKISKFHERKKCMERNRLFAGNSYCISTNRV